MGQTEPAKADAEVKMAEAVKEEPEIEAPKEAPKQADPEVPKEAPKGAPATPENPCPLCGKSLERTTCWTLGECDVCKAKMKKGEPVDRCLSGHVEWWRCEKCTAAKKSG